MSTDPPLSGDTTGRKDREGQSSDDHLSPLVFISHAAPLHCTGCGGVTFTIGPSGGPEGDSMPSGTTGGGRRNTLVLQRLKYLFENHSLSESGAPLTGREISLRAKTLGYDLSTSYVLSLRNGDRTNPSLEALEALAAVFSVDMSYFFTDTKIDEIQADSAVSAAMRNGNVREIALNAARMTPETQQTLANIARELGRLDITRHDASSSGNADS